MTSKYEQIFSPISVQGVVIRNRLYGTKGLPHFLQGPESFPSENVIRYYAGLAKNGAAIVTVKGMSPMKDRTTLKGDSAHNNMWDINNPATHNYFAQIAQMIHYYGSKAFINIQRQQPDGVNISELTGQDVMRLGNHMGMSTGREITVDEIHEMIDGLVKTCTFYQSLGFDGINLYSSYQASIYANSFSPLINKRTDEYADRCRLILDACKAIKKVCGNSFLVELQFSGEEGIDGGYTIDDTIGLLKRGEGIIDFVQLRAINGDLAHPTGLNSEKEAPITLSYSEAIKKAGVKVITVPNGGYQDPELINKWISEGKMDMAAMCRAFICDFEYYDKMLDGRGDDIVPCILCNNCHGINFDGPWYSFCSVNPELGLRDREDLLVSPVKQLKRVAVIGGGPAGMRAALIARQRGHQVTLYEKSGVLGGQLTHSDYAGFKWPVKNYKNWLIHQMEKTGVEVKLNCAPTPEEVSAAGYDSVISATGAVPKRPGITGDSADFVWSPIDVFGNEKKLGKKVVVVGGSETGVETALYLCDCGHDVTVLTRQSKLASDANQIHYIGSLRNYYSALDNFHYAVNATTTEIKENTVSFTVEKPAKNMGVMPPMPGMAGMPPMPSQGKPGPYSNDGQYTLQFDSIVVCGGVSPRQEEALSYAKCAKQWFIIGDCDKPGRIYQCTRAAYAAANQI